jgi:hypothetical protein
MGDDPSFEGKSGGEEMLRSKASRGRARARDAGFDAGRRVVD